MNMCVWRKLTLAEITTYWEQEWDWHDYENRDLIKDHEWKHLRWFYDNCNWRSGRARGTYSVTSTKHGSPTGTARNPCETLYKLLMQVREYMKEKGEKKGEKAWEKVYMEVVKKKDQVMRKGKEGTKKPIIVNWLK